MSDIDPGATLSTTDLGEEEIDEAMEQATDGAHPDATGDALPHPRLVDGPVAASVTGVGTDDLDEALGPTDDGS